MTCYMLPVHVHGNSQSGLQTTPGQRTMSGQNWVLTGQILGLPDILSGHLPTHSEKFNFKLFDNYIKLFLLSFRVSFLLKTGERIAFS